MALKRHGIAQPPGRLALERLRCHVIQRNRLEDVPVFILESVLELQFEYRRCKARACPVNMWLFGYIDCTMTRTDLTDQEWERLESKLPSSQGKQGGQYQDHRRVLNGILWVLRTGAPWRDLPERYAKWKTCHDRLLRWRRQGVWKHVLQAVQGEADAAGAVAWTVVGIDGTTVRAHQDAAGARHAPALAEPPAGAEKGEGAAADEALGRSRGGFSTKLHLAADGRGRPRSVCLTAGQRHESPFLGAGAG